MIIFGLDLRAIKLSAFKSSNMFDDRYYLRSQRFIAYQLAMIVPVVGESMATYCIDKYVNLNKRVGSFQPGASFYNKDLVDVGALSIFSGVYTATAFGTMFFFLLFWPALSESRMWSMIKRISAVLSSVLVFAASLSSTIVVATGHGHLVPSPTGSFQELQAKFANPKPPFYYRHYSYAIPWLVLLWVGWLFTVLSTVYVFKASSFHLDNPNVVETYKTMGEAGNEGAKTAVLKLEG